MFLFDQCPKCRGTVTLVSGLDGNDLQCVHCGFSVPVDERMLQNKIIHII